MRKFSKILTVLLTLALLCGVILSVVAYAEEEPESREALNVSGASHNRYSDFESTNNGTHYFVPYFPWTDGATVGNARYTYEDASDGNTYIRIATLGYDSTKTGNREAWVPVALYDWQYHRTGLHNVGAHDYVTIDFEIGTDKYKYQDAEGAWYMVDKLEDIPEAYRPAAGEEYRALALHNGLDININGRAATTLSGTKNGNEIHQYMHFFLVQDSVSGKWYLADKNTYNAATVKVELSNKIGEFDHITWVIKTERSNVNEKCDLGYDLTGTKAYSFVNGQYFIASSLPGGHDSIVPNAIRFIIPNHYQNSISLCFDNVAINWYGYRAINSTTVDDVTTYAYSNLGTVYVSEGYGIDDYINSGDYKLDGLWKCEDVVYNSDYKTPTAKALTVGEDTYYAVGAAIDAAAASGKEVVTSASFTNVAAPKYVTGFVVVANDGATFALAPESAALYDVITTVDGTTTTYKFFLVAEKITDKNRHDVTGDSGNTITEFSDKALGKLTSSSGAGNFNANTNDSSIYREVILGADGTNKYLRHMWSGVYSPKAIEDTWFPGSQTADVTNGVVGDVTRADYVIWDFDFGTDMYNFTYTASVTEKDWCTCKYCAQTEETAKVVTENRTMSMTVNNKAEFDAYVAEFAKYQADAEPNLDNYPLIKALINVSSKGTNTYNGTKTSNYCETYYKETAKTAADGKGTKNYNFLQEKFVINDVVAINAEQKLELAYLDGDGIGFTLRGYTYNAAASAFAAASKEAWGSAGTIKKVDGVWYLVNGSNSVKLSNELGKFDHFTMVHVPSVAKTDANGRTIHQITTYVFVNGEFFISTVGNNCAAYELYRPERLKITHPNGSLMSKGWAVITDNFASNYYDNYDKTNEGGIGALITAIAAGDKSGKLYNCNDVLYNKSYADLGGYVSFDGGKTVVSIDGAINDAAATLVDGATVITSKDLLDFTPKAGVTNFTVELVNGAQFSLSAEAIGEFWIIESVDEDTLNVVKYSISDAIAFDFVDNTGKVFFTQYLLPGMKLDTSIATERMTKLFDKATATVKHATGWTLNVGKGVVDAEGFTLSTLVGMPKKVTVNPTLAVDGTLDTFAVYYTDEFGLIKLVDELSSYPTAANFYDASAANANLMSADAVSALQNKISNAPNNSTIVLLYSSAADLGGNTMLNAPANKTISLDLNGKTLIHSYGSTSDYGAKMIQLNEGTTFNLYSSKEGAQIFQARYHEKSQRSEIFAMGIFNMADVHVATINIDGDNLKVMGGSLVYYQGGTNTKKPENIGDGKQVTVNIDGGYYYSGLRSAYGIFAAEGPDLYININDATFVAVNDSIYTVFGSRADKGGRIHVNAQGSTFVALNNKGALNRLYYGSPVDGEDSSFKNCTIVASSTSINSKITIGEGCVVAGFDPSLANVTADYAFGSGFSMEANYPKLFMTDKTCLVETGKTFVSDGADVKTYYLSANYYGPYAMRAFWTKSEVTTASYFTTVKANVAAAKTVTWYDVAGEVVTSQLWIDGSTLTHIPAIESVDLDWYDVVYTWDKSTVSGDTAVNPKANVGGNDIKTKYANVTLSSGMTLNIYIPVVDGIDVTGITIGGKAVAYTQEDNIEGLKGNYWVFSWDSAAASFDAAVATVNFKVTDETYGFEAADGKAEIKLDVVRYATLVAESGEYACGSEEANLVLEMMNYKEAVATLLNPEYARNDATKAFYAVVEKHTECKCGVDIAVDADKEVANTEALKAAGITGATFDMDDLGVISMILESENADLTVVVTYYDGMTVQPVEVEYNAELKAYVAKDIPAAYIDNIMTINVGAASGQYCLAAYIQSIPTIEGLDEATKAKVTNVATALYEYAMAAEAYKHVTKAEAAK